MPDWDKIRAEYIAGGTSYRKLAAGHGVSFSALRRVAAKEKWTDLRAQTEHKTRTKIVKKVAEKKAVKADKLELAADALLARVYSLIGDATEELRPQELKQLAGALKDIKELKGVRSERDVREQEARIAKLERETGGDGGNRVVFELEGELARWSE